MIDLAVGGSWPGPPGSETTFPATMLVDYARVYQQSGSAVPPPRVPPGRRPRRDTAPRIFNN